MAKAAEAKVLRTNRVRADTTVVPANVAYPTDSGLLAKAIRRIARDRQADPGRRRRGAHPAAGPLPRGGQAGARDRGETAVPHADWVATRPRRGAARSPVSWPTWPRPRRRDAAAAAGQRQAGAAPGPGQGRRRCAARGERDAAAGRRRGRLVRAVNDLTDLLDATRQIAAQTRQRIAGITPDGATRVVSLHDPDARPIAKGRLGKPVEFGYKAQVVDNDDGIVARPHRRAGQPARRATTGPRDRTGHQARTGRAPRTVTADRGYGESRVDDDLHDLGRAHRRDPPQRQTRQGPPAVEHRPAFRRTIKWRTGCEGRISTLKRGYGWDRTRIDTTEGARIWTGHGVFTHNLIKISTLAA